MWAKFRKQQAVEREQLRRLLATMQPVLAKCREERPTEIELSALAAMLHSFYTGIENIFKRVTVELDANPVRGESWHRELLDRMGRTGPRRPALLSVELRERLQEYLGFRHVFRHAYSFELDWEKMAPLVLNCELTLQQLEAALDQFLGSAAPSEGGA